MKPSKIAESVGNLFTKGGVTPSEPTNTHVELASQSASEQEVRPDHGERDGDGNLPKLAALSNDRARVLKEIAERRNAQAVVEGDETVVQRDEDGNELESAPAAPEVEGKDLDAGSQEQSPDAGDTEPVAAQPAPAVPAPEEMRTLIIDGQSVQVPVSKIIETGQRALQKEIAADARLNQASQLLAEAKRLAEQQSQPKQPAGDQPVDMTLAEATRLIRYGDDEQATKAMEWFQARQQPVKTEEIVRAAKEAVAPQMAFEAGKNFVQTEYGDLLADPDYRAIFLSKENALRESGDQRPYVELYKAIGDEMRVKFNKPKPGSTTLPAAKPSTPSRSMEEKRAAKANAPAAPKLASARLDGEGTEPRPPSRGEVIDRMRKARAFQPYAAQK